MIHTNETPDTTPPTDFLEEYVRIAPIACVAYEIDSFKNRTYIMNYITVNSNAEPVIQALQNTRDGKVAFTALSELNTEVGIHSVNITKADQIIATIFYQGEKQPHMWWSEFEKVGFGHLVFPSKESKERYFQMNLSYVHC